MSGKSRADALQAALEHLGRNPQNLSPTELQSRIRQLAKQAILEADAAESAGKTEEAVALYRLAAQAYRRVADLASGDLRALELATAQSWEEHADLVDKYRTRRSATETPPQPPGPRESHSPTPIPISSQTRIERGQAGKPPGFTVGDSRSAERIERPPHRQVEERDRQANDRSAFRKSGQT